jgi:predicted phosphodiesterase
MEINNKSIIVKSFITKFSGLSHRQISVKIYEENPHLFKNLENARTMVRYYAGKVGKKNRKSINNAKSGMESVAKQNKAVLEKWGISKTKAKGKKSYQIPSQYDRILWISDIHIPNHDEVALSTALEYGLSHKANCIIIGGDLLDNAPFTRFRVPPALRKAKDFFDQAVSFLTALRKNFPEAHIVYMEGNHDRWYSDWLIDHCAVVFDDPYYQLEARLKLEELNILFLTENVIVKAGKLPMLHGHTIVRGVFAPVNAARGAYTKSNHNLLIGHTHQVSVHSAKDLMGRPTKTWSVGCLCTLSPDYDPHNIRHSHGFAFITTETGGKFTVRNFEIVDGEIR